VLQSAIYALNDIDIKASSDVVWNRIERL